VPPEPALDHDRASGEAFPRQEHRLHTRPAGQAGVEGLGHGAKVDPQSPCLRPSDAERLPQRVGIHAKETADRGRRTVTVERSWVVLKT